MPRLVDATDPVRRQAAVAEAAELLRAGALVAFPTETVYGLGASARNARAVERLFRAKGRPFDHPLIVHLPSGDAIDEWAEGVPVAARILSRALWPGPLTLVLAARSDARGPVTGGQATIALRVPGHEVAQALLRELPSGLAAPSANRFGRVSPTTAAHVLSEFAEAPGAPAPLALVLDGGACEVGLESTIVDLSTSSPRLLRPGGVPRARIEELLGRRLPAADAAGPRAPGRMARHYAPVVPARRATPRELRTVPDEVAVIARSGTPTPARSGTQESARRLWILPDDPAGYGHRLYAALRDAERSGATEIWIAEVPSDEAWLAVADRVARATSGIGEEAP